MKDENEMAVSRKDQIEFLELITPRMADYSNSRIIIKSIPVFYEEEPRDTQHCNHESEPYTWTYAAPTCHGAVDKTINYERHNARQSYFTPALFDETKFEIRDEDDPYKPGMPRASNHNRGFLCSSAFYLDIDCGKPESQFKNDRQALEFIIEFIKKSNMFKFHLDIEIITSGMGLHVYFPMRQVFTDRLRWVLHANTLCDLMQKFGLKMEAADRAVNTDACRILRLPGTYYRKQYQDHWLTDWIYNGGHVNEFDQLIKWFNSHNIDPNNTKPVRNSQITINPSGDGQVVIEKCGAVKKIMEMDRPHDFNPHFRKACAIASLFDDSEQLVRQMTPTYLNDGDHASDVNYAANTIEDYVRGDYASHFCAHLDREYNSCHGCPLQGLNRTPHYLTYESPAKIVKVENDVFGKFAQAHKFGSLDGIDRTIRFAVAKGIPVSRISEIHAQAKEKAQ